MSSKNEVIGGVFLIALKVFFSRGQVVKVEPDVWSTYSEHRDEINRAEIIVSDGIEYNLSDLESIRSIRVPSYVKSHQNPHALELGVTGFLEYVLRMHAGILWNELKFNLAIACLSKASQLMLQSSISWRRNDFYRIVYWHTELGAFRKANEWREWINSHTLSTYDMKVAAFNSEMNICKNANTDLVEVGYIGACCELCAKYRNRIYRISGSDFRFPKFPDDFDFACGLSVHPFFKGISTPTFGKKTLYLIQ